MGNEILTNSTPCIPLPRHKPNQHIPPWAITQNTGLLPHKILGFSPRQEAVFDFSVHPEGIDNVGN